MLFVGQYNVGSAHGMDYLSQGQKEQRTGYKPSLAKNGFHDDGSSLRWCSLGVQNLLQLPQRKLDCLLFRPTIPGGFQRAGIYLRDR